jgi:hypothetical protein
MAGIAEVIAILSAASTEQNFMPAQVWFTPVVAFKQVRAMGSD